MSAEEVEELQVELGVNTELVKDLRKRVDVLAAMHTEGMAELQTKVDSIARDDVVHDAHHEWVEAQLVITQTKALFWRRAFENVAAAGVWGTILAVAGVIWYAIKQFIKNGGSQ